MDKQNSSYNQIIKSTSIFGGSQAISIIIGVVRTKIVAILLGTAGVGLLGIYQSIIDMMRSVTSLGIDTGGVKEIATADSSGDKDVRIKTISIFKQWFMLTAWLGLFACAVFCMPISIWAFGDPQYSMPIAALSICVFLITLSTGRSVVLQGLRQIGFMAKAGAWASIIGLVTTVPLYYYMGTEGIILALIVTSLVLYFCTEYYYRKLKIKTVKVNDKEAFSAGLNTLKLGMYIVLAGIISTVTMFAIRTYLIRNMGIDAAGLFQSAWVITNVYLGLILKSMGSDFFPRLCSIANIKEKVKTLVNEQTYIILVIASPIIVGMLIFSDFALSVLYSSKFSVASGILQWQILGTFLKIITWPIAFILLAKNKGMMFLFSEIIFFGIYLLSCYLLFPTYGIDATGIGYFIAYVAYFAVIFGMGRRVSEFTWNSPILKMILINTVLICAAFYIIHYQPQYTYIGGSIIFIISLVYSFFKLRKVFTINDFKAWFKKKE